MGFVPFANDAYELFVGKSIVKGESLSNTERAIAGVGLIADVLTLGAATATVGAVKLLGRLGKNIFKRARALDKLQAVQKIFDRSGEIYDSARKLGFKTSEGVKDFADLSKRILGNEVGAVGDIGKALRKSYTREVGNLSNYVKKLERNGESLENVARAVSKKRRDLGIKYKAITPQNKLESFFARNVEKYGDKWGPSVEYLRSKGKSWEQIIESAARPGGADLGL